MNVANLQSIVISNAIGLVLLLGLFASSGVTRGRSTVQGKIFTVGMLVCAGACVFEPLTWLVDGKPGMLAHVVNVIGNTYCYLATNIYAYVWVLYVDLRLSRSDRIERWYTWLLVPTILASVAIVGNIWGRYLFVVNEHNVYSRLPPSYVNYALSFASLFFSVHLRNKYQRELGTAQFFSIWLFLAPVYLGAMLQALFFGLSLAWPSVCVGLTLMYLNQQNELSYVDSLTGLYNRTYLEYEMRRMELDRRGGAGIMIDLDFFKAINDTYGHAAGDEALTHVAHLLMRSVPKDAVVIRFAGDEFVVLMRAADEDLVKDVVRRVADALRVFNESGAYPYELMLSMGYDIFHAGEDTSDSFLRRIDDAMYDQKRWRHAAYRSAEGSVPSAGTPEGLEMDAETDSVTASSDRRDIA